VGAGTWIGTRSTILGGASIGAASIVAASATVLPKDYGPNCLLAGLPAKIVRQLNE
jgi:maltose O-acetyltransferase